MEIRTLCVFCGSVSGHNKVFAENAYNFGKLLAAEGIRLIYGGAKVGMMGHVADGALANGGKVTGVLPVFFKEKEIAHDKIDEMILVDSMHERKQIMFDMSDAFVALPGGYGTLDEISEVLTLAQLGKFQKPLGFLNTEGFFDAFFSMVDTMHDGGFIKDFHKDLFVSATESQVLMTKLKSFSLFFVRVWIKQ